MTIKMAEIGHINLSTKPCGIIAIGGTGCVIEPYKLIGVDNESIAFLFSHLCTCGCMSRPPDETGA